LPGGGAFNDDDLKPVSLMVDGSGAGSWADNAADRAHFQNVKLQISYEGPLSLWLTENKAPLREDLSYAVGSGGSDVPDTIYVEGTDLGEGSITLDLYAATDASPGGEVVASATLELSIIHVDLQTCMIMHNAQFEWLPEEQEESPGAYVPLNNDADAYDHYDGQSHDDRDAPGAIPDEDDLLPIWLREIQPWTAGGTYTLHVTGNVRVWANADRSGLKEEGSTFDATVETQLYVEGYSSGAGTISVDWSNGTQQLANADALTVNVFDWIGPLNVPDYSKYDYLARGGEPGASGWLDPGGGITDSITQLPEEWEQITIKWNGGPQVGKAVYQASQGYIWDLNVNVVQVTVGNPDLPAQPFAPGTPFDAGTRTVRQTDRKAIASGTVTGLSWQAKVTLNGPEQGRGVKFMRVGFVQNADDTRLTGTYGDQGPVLTSDLQGQSFLDCSEQSTAPPYFDCVYQVWSCFLNGGKRLRFFQ